MNVFSIPVLALTIDTEKTNRRISHELPKCNWLEEKLKEMEKNEVRRWPYTILTIIRNKGGLLGFKAPSDSERQRQACAGRTEIDTQTLWPIK